MLPWKQVAGLKVLRHVMLIQHKYLHKIFRTWLSSELLSWRRAKQTQNGRFLFGLGAGEGRCLFYGSPVVSFDPLSLAVTWLNILPGKWKSLWSIYDDYDDIKHE